MFREKFNLPTQRGGRPPLPLAGRGLALRPGRAAFYNSEAFYPLQSGFALSGRYRVRLSRRESKLKGRSFVAAFACRNVNHTNFA